MNIKRQKLIDMLPEYFYNLMLYKANESNNGEDFAMFWVEDEGWSVPCTATYENGKVADILMWNVYYGKSDEGCDFDLGKVADINRRINANI